MAGVLDSLNRYTRKTALDAATPLVECAVMIDVSIPVILSCSFIQRPIVGTEAGPWGLLLLSIRREELWHRAMLQYGVNKFPSFDRTNWNIKTPGCDRHSMKGSGMLSLSWFAKSKRHFGIRNQFQRIEESSQVLKRVQRANKVTNFQDSSRREKSAPAVASNMIERCQYSTFENTWQSKGTCCRGL